MYRWLTGLEPDGKWMSWLTRETLEQFNTYTEAKAHLMTTPMLSPVYYILGGLNPWEAFILKLRRMIYTRLQALSANTSKHVCFQGSIITRSLNGTDLLTELNPTDKNGWYLLETNYDLDKPVTNRVALLRIPKSFNTCLQVLYLDDRRTPGNHCMQKLGQKNVDFQGIFNVLSSRTNLNKLTTYTVLMQVENGRFETIMQSCPGYCWPF
ncbi:hypothetical protein ANCDUO_09774 [Ancylostoma duodenale]|uniref:ceramidase n=1 Tax=Ancylostoma duodenale TaxID=51022 RepID=A0A0C2DC19_9BILA|nr:hypothetical protein ANCDUO_09774 [Ancylostoma duodenale]